MQGRTQNRRSCGDFSRELGFRRLSVAMVVGGLIFLALQTPAPAAGWFKKRLVRDAEPAAATSNASHGYAGTIRRLQQEAQAAADRGDMATARILAERAHKLALTCRAMLINDPDCSPENTAAFASRFSAPSAAPNKSAAPSSSAVVQAIDLTPLLDEEAAKEKPQVPPSPAPPVASPKAAAAPPATAPVADRAKRRDAVPDTTASHKPSLGPATEMRPAITTKSAAPRKSSGAELFPLSTASSPKREPSAATGFLVMRSDWLREDADAKESIKKQNEPRSAAVRPFAPETDTNDADLHDLDADDDAPEVTTAIGREDDADWELDTNSDDDVAFHSPPQLPADNDDRFSARDAARTSPVGVGAASRPGTWSATITGLALRRTERDVVTLSEFLDPAALTPMPEHHAGDATESSQMIETNFNTVSAPNTSSVVEAIETSHHASAEPTALVHDDDPAPIPRRSAAERRVVSFREDPALDWLPVTDPPASSRTDRATPHRYAIPWPNGTVSDQAIIGGVLLVLCGVILFGVSLRRS